MRLSDFKKTEERRRWVEETLHIQLDGIKHALQENEEVIHCENLIGAISVPLGIAGPIQIQGEYASGEFYVPLATTEGALVASTSRGCKAITKSGGASVSAYRVGVTRGPVFYVGSLKKNREFFSWLKKNEDTLKKIAESTSSHLTYRKMIVKGVAQYVFVRFHFDTQDAMGMNMATIATEKMVEYIKAKSDATCISIAGNFDIDKKPAWMNFIENRGFKAWAETTIPKKTVLEVLKTTSEQLFDVWMAKCMVGSAMSGSLGFNAHFANVIAAVFAATGQDLAHIGEGSMGITTTKVLENGDLYASVYLPDLMIGTVGGGTNLKTQTEARAIMGVKGSHELAEVIAGVVLAGEVSLLASLAEGSLARAHSKLGR